MLSRRTLLQATAATALLPAAPAGAAETPGVTATEIRIGNTNAHSGPASAYGTIANVQAAYFDMVNAQGGINGRKITFITLDDAYSPPRTVEQTRKLVEQEGVAFLFGGLGTPTQTAVRAYLNARRIPQLFLYTGAEKWADPQHFPWTIGYNPSYQTEAIIYAKYILKEKPDAKVAVLYQNDDFGKDYVIGLKKGLGDKYGRMVVKEVTYETTDPTIDSQIVSLQGSGADVLVTAATPKFAAQAIRKVAALNWHPLHIMTNVSISVASVLMPAGLENAKGLVSAAWGKDPTDKRWENDPAIKDWRAFMAKYMPGGDVTDANNVSGVGGAMIMMQVLKQCGNDLSRANVMRQAANLKDLEVPVLLPGMRVNTSPTDFHAIRSMQLERWTGTTWDLFGELITA